MRLVLKAALTLLSTLAVANVMAQCGPRGCGYQNNNSNSENYPAAYSESYSTNSSNNGGYNRQNQYDQSESNYQRQSGQDNSRSAMQNRQQRSNYDQHRMRRNNQQSTNNNAQYGYDSPMADHPVTNHDGQHIRYYGEPGPDYNSNSMQQGTQQGMMQNKTPKNIQSNMQKTSYNSNQQRKNWEDVADADTLSGSAMHNNGMEHDHATHDERKISRLSGGGTYKARSTVDSTSINDTTGMTDSATSSKW